MRLGPVSEALNIVCLFGFVFIIFTSLTTEQVSVAPHKVMLKVSPKAMVLTRQKKTGVGGGGVGGEGAVGEAESSKAVWYLELSCLKFWVCP